MNQRGLRKERTGIVIRDRMEKTVVVSVERTVMHLRYKKYLRRRTKVKALMKQSEPCGAAAFCVECRPLSRDKRWRVK
jgi:small subunit ribosomal protein S17